MNVDTLGTRGVPACGSTLALVGLAATRFHRRGGAAAALPWEAGLNPPVQHLQGRISTR